MPHYNPQVSVVMYEVWQGDYFVDAFLAFDIEDCLDLAIQRYPELDYHTFIILRAF